MKSEYLPILTTFERLAESYGDCGGMEEVNRRLLAPLVREWEGRILDVGCGAGNLIEKYVDPSRREVFTVDFSWNMISEAGKRLGGYKGRGLYFVRGLAQALPFRRDSFDAALSVNTLHNMPSAGDVRQAVAEMARVVRPRGLLMVEFRNAEHPERRRISETHDVAELPQKVFSLGDVRGFLEDAGFSVEQAVPLSGERCGDGFFRGSLDRIMKKIMKESPEMTPRFAVLARKGPGFRTVAIDGRGMPVTN